MTATVEILNCNREERCVKCTETRVQAMVSIDPCISQVYHLRSLAKSWKNPPETEVAVNGSSLTWLLREVFTGLHLNIPVFFLNNN